MILPYQMIKERCERDGLLTPWSEPTVFEGMTYGLGPAGYDIRVDQDVRMGGHHTFELYSSLEHFDMPDDLIARVCDKSTLARRGLFVQNTVIEPGWRGYLTLELTYHAPSDSPLDDIKLSAGSPIAQIIFEQLAAPTEYPYRGKYQNQAARPVAAIEERPRTLMELHQAGEL